MSKYISMEQYLMGRIKIEDLSKEQLANMNTLVPKINEIIDLYGKPLKMNSGYRSFEDQMRVNPRSPHSKHTLCAAIDLGDIDHNFRLWCLTHISEIAKLDLYMEDPSHTEKWIHLQSIAPKSGYRIFIP